ncbi:MAG: invasion associated locus B family protein [Amaricoccus sp.]
MQTFVATLLASLPAIADPPAAWHAPEPFRDWQLDCPGTACPAHTSVRGSDGSEVLRVIAAAGPAPVLRILTPLPLYLPDGIALTLGGAPPWVAPWRTCGADGCEATLALDPLLLARLRSERSGNVTLTLVDGVKVRLSFSLHGVSAALDARGG